jgi:hypothetical protein
MSFCARKILPNVVAMWSTYGYGGGALSLSAFDLAVLLPNLRPSIFIRCARPAWCLRIWTLRLATLITEFVRYEIMSSLLHYLISHHTTLKTWAYSGLVCAWVVEWKFHATRVQCTMEKGIKSIAGIQRGEHPKGLQLEHSTWTQLKFWILVAL